MSELDDNEVLEFDNSQPLELAGDYQEELKITMKEEEKKQFVSKIKQKTNIKFDSIESKINQLLENAEKYALFLLHRHRLTQQRQEKLENKKEKQDKQQGRHRTEQQSDSEDQQQQDDFIYLDKQPSSLKGELKSYQLTGLNWMISLYESGINGILADEMGLGKTIQSISLIAFLKEYKKINGPYLIVGPKSTLGNWMREFRIWLPCCRVVKLIAVKEERDEIINNYMQPGRFDVCLTSYEGVNICMKHIKRFTYKYIIIDEAHKIKNEVAQISQNLRRLKTNYKLLLTGTPLQNNPHELWSLLNYLLPDLFDSSEVFDKWFEVNAEAKQNNENLDERNLEMVHKFQKILRPFMLRRTKAEVERYLPPKKEIHLYINMSNQQRQMYQNILLNNTLKGDGEDSRGYYMNKLMQLRKICLHPYLFPEVEDRTLPPLGEHLIEVSGKMRVLDKFLKKLKEGEHQVLLFSQFTMMLNILEDYCNYRQFEYCRIDGDTEIQLRDDQIAEFTRPKTHKFIFLLSTRAGGLGINLASADTVILFDSDFNPQMDLQAMDRAHRIGQKNQVMVYRMACEHTVEEKIIERQQIKLRWDQIMVQNGQKKASTLLSKEDLKELTTFGASSIFKMDADALVDEEIDILLERGERLTKELNERIEKKFQKVKNKELDLGLGQINIFDFFEDRKNIKEDEAALELRAANLVMQTRNQNKRIAGHQKPTKKMLVPDYHLYEDKDHLQYLLQKEENYCHRNDEDLSTEERTELKRLLDTGFKNWSKQEYHEFLSASEKYGRHAIDKIQEAIKTKTLDEVRAYKAAFWDRINQLNDKEKILKAIERGEKLLTQNKEGRQYIEEKCKNYHFPKYEIQFINQIYNKFKSKYFSIENDKYLVFMTNEVGFGNWTDLKKAIKNEPMFKFDHAFKCKSELDLKNRVIQIVKILQKEYEHKQNNGIVVPKKQSKIEKPQVLLDAELIFKKVKC